MEIPQLSASQQREAALLHLTSMALGHLFDDLCGYFEVESHVLCADVNSVWEHDKALHLVEDVDAPHLLDAQRARFEQSDFRGHGHAFRW